MIRRHRVLITMDSRITQLSHLVELERQGLDFTCKFPTALAYLMAQRTDS
jgi:hypothetical protein